MEVTVVVAAVALRKTGKAHPTTRQLDLPWIAVLLQCPSLKAHLQGLQLRSALGVSITRPPMNLRKSEDIMESKAVSMRLTRKQRLDDRMLAMAWLVNNRRVKKDGPISNINRPHLARLLRPSSPNGANLSTVKRFLMSRQHCWVQALL